jgi:hypothetical protein
MPSGRVDAGKRRSVQGYSNPKASRCVSSNHVDAAAGRRHLTARIDAEAQLEATRTEVSSS